MTSFDRRAIIAGIACLLFITVGCQQGPTNGAPIAGCPDGIVEYLVVSESGEIKHKEGRFLQLVDRTDQKLVMVDFWAPWCGPCRTLAPRLESVKKEWGDKVELVKVDVDQCPQINQYLHINGIPDVRIFRNGTQVGSFVGSGMSRQDIEALLKSLQ